MSDYDDLLNPIRRTFKLGLFDVLDINWKIDIRSSITLLLLALLNIGSFIFVCKNLDDVENIQDAAEAAGVMGSGGAVFSKLIILLLKRKEVISFSDDMKRQYSKNLNEHPDITKMYARHFSLITKLYTGVLFSLPTLYTISSLFGNDEPTLPILMETPFLPSKGWPYFHISFFMQISIMWLGCNAAVGVELLSFFYVQYVCCRIEILAHMVQYWNDNMKCSHGGKSNFLFEEIVRYHSSIKQNMATVKRIFSPMLMSTLLSNSIVICMCLIIIFTNPVLKVFCHIIVALSQTFMYCFVGNLLMKQNDNLVEKVMLVDFDFLNVSERKAYMNVVQNACNPIKLQSYFVTVDMTLFFKVLKFAYSAFSLMRTKV